MFERALLISIFFIQVFAFVHSQFAAVFGLVVNVLLFFAVRSILAQELEQEAAGRAGGSPWPSSRNRVGLRRPTPTA